MENFYINNFRRQNPSQQQYTASRLKACQCFVSKAPQGNIYKIGELDISKVTHGANAKTQTGTLYYAAPEIWKGDLYNWSCDIWSIGCIIYEMASTHPLFRAQDLISLNYLYRLIQQQT